MAPASHSWSPERGLVRWAGALVLTLALHGAALAAGLMRWEQVEPPMAPPGAIMMELAPLPQAPAAPETQAVPEPRQPDASPVARAEPEPQPEPEHEPRPESTAQPRQAAALPLPPIDPVPPSQRDPDVALSEPAPEKPKTVQAAENQKARPVEKAKEKAKDKPKNKPKDKPKEAAKVKVSQQPEDKPKPEAKPVAPPAAEGTAPQPAQNQAASAAPVQQAAIAAAPSAAETARRAAAEANWQGLLLAHLERYKKYPKSAQRRNQQGTPYLLIRMDRSGKVLSYALKRSSGVEALDAEVLDLVARAEPLPPLPLEMPQAVMEVVVPVSFALK